MLDQVKEVINACRTLTGVPVVLGGAGYSIYPESVLAYLGADMGVKGEGEAAFSALLDYLERGIDPSAIPGLCLPGKGIKFANRFTKNLDELPFPNERLWLSPALVKQDVWIPLQTRRGCPMNCSYCSSPLIEGRARRVHSPEGVVEMQRRYVKAGFSRFYFTDNTFNIPCRREGGHRREDGQRAARGRAHGRKCTLDKDRPPGVVCVQGASQ